MTRRVELERVHAAGRAAMSEGTRAFHTALRDPQGAQEACLRRIVGGAVATEFGRTHALEGVETLAQFRDAVPLGDHESHRPWIEREARGERKVLTTETPLAYDESSGSSGPRKLLPITESLLDEFRAGLVPWLASLQEHHPGLRSTTAYWSISPLARAVEDTADGTRIGLEDDTLYLGSELRQWLGGHLSVPGEVGAMPDMESCRYATGLHLIADSDLGLFSVWNPSFLTLLVDSIVENWSELLVDLRQGRPGLGVVPQPERARQLEGACGPGGLDHRQLWPHLTLISCWADAAAARCLPALQSRLPGVPVAAKGLLSTEGIVSTPIGGSAAGHPLAMTSHLLEFLPEDGGSAVAAHELELGRRYETVLTTSGGLYRYRMGDIVEVVGQAESTPTVRFVGRGDGVSDLRGEKLSPAHVERALRTAAMVLGTSPAFAMLAPVERDAGESLGYQLFLSGDPGADWEAYARCVEVELARNPHYANCRRLGQLTALRLAVTDGGVVARYERKCIKLGMRAGDIKPAALRRELDWAEALLAGEAQS